MSRAALLRVLAVPILVVATLTVAGGAAHAGGITGFITLYPQGSSVSPGPISGNGSGDLWYEAGVGSEAHLRRMSVSSGLLTADGPTGLKGGVIAQGAIAAAAGGGAYWSEADPHGAQGAGWVGYAADSAGNVSIADGRDLTTVTTLGSTVYWGACSVPPSVGNVSCKYATSNAIESGFPTQGTVHNTPTWVTSMVPDGSSLEFVLNDRYPGFYFLGSISICNGLNAPFPGSSDIVDMAYGAAGLWFADAGRDSIWQETGPCTATEHGVPDGTTPRHITEGVDGRIYFTTSSGIWSASGTGSSFEQFVDPGLVDPEGITSGSDGNIWFTDTEGHQIGKLDIDPNFGIGALRFHDTVFGTINKGTIQVDAPGGITAISSDNPDFQVPSDPTDLQAPPNLQTDCPSTCYIGVTFAPPVGTPPGTQTGELHVTLATGEQDAYPLSGNVVAFGPPTSKDDCKDGNWQQLRDDAGNPFKNQGQCIKYVNHLPG